MEKNIHKKIIENKLNDTSIYNFISNVEISNSAVLQIDSIKKSVYS